jgi:site-specific DNA-methyltransferase (adenine-specific)
VSVAATIADVLEGRARWCVIEGDCLDVMREMPDRSVGHVITDPPYEAEAHTLNRRLKSTSVDGGKKWQRRGGETKQKPLDFVPITAELRASAGAEIGRLTRGWAIVFCQFEGALLWRACLEPPLVWKRPCIWVKPDGMPCLIGDRPGMGYEVFVALHAKGRSKWNGGGRTGVFTHCKDHGGGAGIRQEHPTTKPLGLMTELVSLFSFDGDILLDPFAGSGTTGVAALRLGRRCILIEKDPKYAALCRERLAAEESGNTLQAARAGQEMLFGAK